MRGRPHTVRVARAHEIPERAPIRIEPGDVVEVGRRDTTWPEFVFVTTRQGQGWVPARHLEFSGDHVVVLNGYDTAELAAGVGEILEVLERDDVSGWLWCRDGDGNEGWVPAASVE